MILAWLGYSASSLLRRRRRCLWRCRMASRSSSRDNSTILFFVSYMNVSTRGKRSLLRFERNTYVHNVCRTVSLSWPAKSSELIRRREQLSSFGILKCAQVYYYVGRPVPDPTTNTTGPRRIAEKQNPVTQLWREFWTNQRINYLFWAEFDRGAWMVLVNLSFWCKHVIILLD